MLSRAAVVAEKPASVIKKCAAVVVKKPASVIKKCRPQFEQGEIVLRPEFQDTEYANSVFTCVVNKQEKTATTITQRQMWRRQVHSRQCIWLLSGGCSR